ncbi:MAG: thermonuclease family protein [Thiohalophilus sp.]|uniref:thermonuclease family protein n=1 Tax=Thiohalophilus sp. TaxID=3028392 RepID=UPI00286FE3B8|nr:thermonuclease family protein [Thiohalophilus sp.]MDR9436506.1 thermonuclease family protein [Thiohalophilus sp.]
MTKRTTDIIKKALFSAPFLLVVWSSGPMADACRPVQLDEKVTVRYVHDGDTVHLRDGRKLRLIGINTPERARDEAPAEPHAGVARRQLQALAEGPWGLVYDREQRDHYGRLLAHVFDQQGRNITRRLLEGGAGQLLVIPPNLRFLDCYRRAQAAARRHKRGLWALSAYQTLPVAALSSQHSGQYRVVRGYLSRIGESRSSLWLNLGPAFALRIARPELPHFERDRIETWHDQPLFAQGWIYRRNNQWRMRLRHPAALLEIP